MKLAHVRNDVDFGVAFAAARSAGADQFRWRGSDYTTKREDDPKPPGLPVVLHIEEINGREPN